MSRPERGRPLLVVAGEASGDLHAARLLAELRRLVPDVEPFGLGGDELAAAGLERIADSSEISVVGITEALRVLRRAREIFAELLAEVDRRHPAAAVLVDFPEFNLRLARELAERDVRVVYYISPQIWAWRRGRVRTIARTVDKMLVVFPFEADFYAGHDVDVTHVGHPLVDEVPELPHVWDQGDPAGRGAPYRIALLPGSRESEIEANLPLMLDAAGRLAERLPVDLRLIRAPSVPAARVAEQIARSGLPVRISERDRYRAIADTHLALCASGTATLEVGLLGTPLVVVYRLSPGTYLAGRALVRLPHVSLVNLVLGHEAVPEVVQVRADPERVAEAAAGILREPGRVAAMRRDLAGLRPRLGERGASARAAREVAVWLDGDALVPEQAAAAAAGGGGRR